MKPGFQDCQLPSMFGYLPINTVSSFYEPLDLKKACLNGNRGVKKSTKSKIPESSIIHTSPNQNSTRCQMETEQGKIARGGEQKETPGQFR